MGVEDWNVDPELEQLLREVAADPRATLLRIARPQAIRSVYESSIVARESATGLLAAERQLLRVHREELARLLRRACVMLIFESPSGRAYTMRHVTATYRHDPPTRERWLDDARLELAVSKPDVATDVVTLLERCVTDVASRRATISQLAAASARLQRTAQADIYRGEELAMAGMHGEAADVFELVTTRTASQQVVAATWNNLGKSLQEMNEVGRALRAFEHAIACDDSLAMPFFNRLGAAWLALDAECVRDAAKNVDDRFHENDSAVADYLDIHANRSDALTASNSNRAALLHSLGIELSNTSRRILYALR